MYLNPTFLVNVYVPEPYIARNQNICVEWIGNMYFNLEIHMYFQYIQKYSV